MSIETARIAPRRWMFWAAGAYAGILLVVAAGLVLLYQAARGRLDEALGQRLLATAGTAAYLVNGDRLLDWAFDPQPDTEFLWLGTRLQQIRHENDLAEIALCDHDGFILFSASGRLEHGAQNVFWDIDRPAVEQAREGFASASRLYRSGDLYQKSAHAPILDRDGNVTGVLTVEGDADFFDALATLRRGAWLTGAVVIAFLTGLGLVLVRINLSLERSRTLLLRQESLTTMGRMTANIAHEIRNPLGIIRGAAQHLQRLLRDHGLEDEVATFIPDEVDRLDRILAGYLALGSNAPAEFEELDLAALARRTVRLVRDELQGNGVTVELVEPLPAAPCRGDPRRLQQVLLNLLLNARDAMPDSGRVTVSLASHAGTHALSVADEGRGLSAAAGQRAFEPFWTTKEKSGGLGLTVSRGIAREHGGDLTLANRTDRTGCVAVLSLPDRTQ